MSKNLKLEDIKVQSFITNLEDKDAKKIMAAAEDIKTKLCTDHYLSLCVTSPPVYCACYAD